MSRSRLQGEPVDMSYFYSVVDQVYGFEITGSKVISTAQKRFPFLGKVQQDYEQPRFRKSNVASMGVPVTSSTCRAPEQLLFGWLGSHRTLAPC